MVCRQVTIDIIISVMSHKILPRSILGDHVINFINRGKALVHIPGFTFVHKITFICGIKWLVNTSSKVVLFHIQNLLVFVCKKININMIFPRMVYNNYNHDNNPNPTNIK